MKRFVLVLVVALVATSVGVGLAAVSGPSATKPPTTASLMPAYVQAAKYWQHPHVHIHESTTARTTAKPPTTSSLMRMYVQAAKAGRR